MPDQEKEILENPSKTADNPEESTPETADNPEESTPETADNPKESATRIILSGEDNRYYLRLKLEDHGMKCYGAITSEDTPLFFILTPQKLVRILKNHNVIYGLNDSVFEDFCKQADETPPVADLLLAEGTPPGPGKDGWVELNTKAAPDEDQPTETDEDKIDHHTQQEIYNFEPGEKIGVIRPPGPGDAGCTVEGNTLPSLIGEPLKIRIGKGVKLEGEDRLIAEMQGRVIREGDKISMTEAYVISGDVDFTVGHIDFNGFVEVQGDVLDGFNIRAAKGLKVHKNVGACQLESEGNIEINGMAGQGKGRIKCGGNLKACFLNDVMAGCQGDVIIQNEIRNSRVYAGGAILITNGLIIGGECIAYGGIEAQNIGALSGVKTQLTGGLNYLELCDKDHLHCEIKEVEQEIDTIKLSLGTASEPGQDISDLPPESHDFAKRLQKLESHKETLTEKLAGQTTKIPEMIDSQINICGMLYEKVVVSLGYTTEEIASERQGPISILEDKDNGRLAIEAMRSLRRIKPKPDR